MVGQASLGKIQWLTLTPACTLALSSTLTICLLKHSAHVNALHPLGHNYCSPQLKHVTRHSDYRSERSGSQVCGDIWRDVFEFV